VHAARLRRRVRRPRLLPAGVGHSSIEIKVSFLAPVRAGNGTPEVEGRALKVGRQVAVAEAHARTGEGKLVAMRRRRSL
jgi:uncharacterized protein (TIGR00369 family)